MKYRLPFICCSTASSLGSFMFSRLNDLFICNVAFFCYSSVAFTWNAHSFALQETSPLLHLIFTFSHLARPFFSSSVSPSVILLHLNNQALFFMFKVSWWVLQVWDFYVLMGQILYVELPISVQVSFMDGLRICWDMYIYFINYHENT